MSEEISFKKVLKNKVPIIRNQQIKESKTAQVKTMRRQTMQETV